MEQAFIWEAPDFSTMNPPETEAWFKKAIAFPDEFTYGKDA